MQNAYQCAVNYVVLDLYKIVAVWPCTMITINLHLNLVWAIPVIVLPISLISFIASPSNFMFCRQDSAQHITSDGAERPFLSQKRQLKCHYALLSRIESNTDITLILRISSGALVPDIMHAKQASKL